MSKASIQKTKATKNRNTNVVKKPKVLKPEAKIRKKPEYKSFRLHKPVKRPDLKIPSWLEITKKALKLLRANMKQIVGFITIYGLLYILFVRGIASPVDIDSIKDEINAVTGGGSTITANVTVMSLLLESAFSSGGDIAGLYQVIFLVVGSLALIWLFRQQQAGNSVTTKDAFYRGMYPVVPFVLVIMIITLQSLPAAIGNFLFTAVSTGGLAVTAFEQFIWILFFLCMLLLSLYMISSSVIALFIVTLPDMTPMLALRKAKELATFRRANVLGKFIALSILVGLLYVGMVLPSIFVSALLAQLALLFVTIFAVPFAVAYAFVLYRELL